MDQLLPLLRLLELNKDNTPEAVSIIEGMIRDEHPVYYQKCIDYDNRLLIDSFKKRYADMDDLKVKHFKAKNKFEISYHVYAGSSGDWHEKNIHSKFEFLHITLGYQRNL